MAAEVFAALPVFRVAAVALEAPAADPTASVALELVLAYEVGAYVPEASVVWMLAREASVVWAALQRLPVEVSGALAHFPPEGW